ncbi:uncharacterized protein LOC134221761 [Armigeres subalbatus]|uniref:uncharacterized protein LOC134221761 n=1 Tax=Armigeres subalbatus TaxID=124917 RepID=UPI002ED2F766
MEIRPDNHTGTEDEAPPFRQFSDNPNKNIPPVVSSETSLRQSLKSRELTIKLLKQNMKSIRRQMFVQDQTSKRRLNASNRYKKLFFSLRKEINVLKKKKNDNEKLGEQARRNPIILDTLKNAMRHPKARRYQPETKKFASGAYLSGPRTYRFVRRSKNFILPHKSTVYGYNKSIRILPGLNKTILMRMKCKARFIKPKRDKLVMVCLDGMSVKPELTYCAKSDIFYGFPFDGTERKIEKNNHQRLATEAVVMMTSGIYSRFKQPVGYLLAHNSLGSHVQMKFVEKSVMAIRKIGLIPMALVMDQCTTNQKMIREAGATHADPLINIGGEDIAVLYDTPHLLKNTRNALLKHNAVFEEELCGEALQTAAFVEFHDKLFDTFNSKERYAASIGKFSSAFKYAMLTVANEVFDEGKNCENDGRQPMLNEEDLVETDTHIEESPSFKNEPLDQNIPLIAQKQDLNALVYILGIAISKLSHEKCRAKLKAVQDCI